MDIDWQWLVVIAAVLWAVTVVVRRATRWSANGCGSGGCDGCEASSARTSRLVSLEIPAPRAPQEGSRRTDEHSSADRV